MKKITLFFVFLALYETVKIVFILVTRPAINILSLPFSWYAAVPLLLIPLFCSIFLAADPQKYVEYCFILILSKIMYLLSSMYYCYDALSLLMNNLITISFDAIFQFALFLLIFFIIDGILCIVISITGKRIKSLNVDSEGSICK